MNLFGLNIAKLVADGIAAAGNVRPGTLSQEQAQGVVTHHTFRGFVEVRQVRIPDTGVVEEHTVLTLLGDTVSPAAVPQVNDQYTLDSHAGELSRRLKVDPAGAVYEFEVR